MYHIAGITGFWKPSEWVYAMVGKLCQHFNLPGPNPTSVKCCCDKFVQRQFLKNAAVPVPSFRLAANAADVQKYSAEIGLPVVLKPTVGQCSSGVRLCRTADELTEHTTYLLREEHIWPSSPGILVEEFVNGPFLCAHLIGNELIGVSAGKLGPLPHFFSYESIVPALLAKDQYKRIRDISLDCLQALGLGWGPTNIDLLWTKRGPIVIEVNPRLGGAPDPQLIQLSIWY
ncbi:ATP-grasp domain-containing protein [Mesorhizobium dulcispinae]|uniref:ATP-grasp domain-containing protein n=1 Tax=Mesorhizobium dulcispinae TaxID=3072316 RepID=UPI002A23EE3F|nr:ATP-grasp domain-containing protein [Mesorhizobium sp. VK23D]MDX8522735.1 ATP-grasp domain-containing protein [Mesorhizobium sp. VK23D]